MFRPRISGITKFDLLPTVLLFYMITFGVVDLLLDDESIFSLHFAAEATFIVFGGVLAIYLWVGWRKSHHSLKEIELALEAQGVEHDRWRRRAEKLLIGLGEEIDAQLLRWKLTRTERQIAVLLIKGFSHKQIADSLDRSESTIRQHGGSIYKKSGLAGRAELGAFFLADLILPRGDSED